MLGVGVLGVGVLGVGVLEVGVLGDMVLCLGLVTGLGEDLAILLRSVLELERGVLLAAVERPRDALPTTEQKLDNFQTHWDVSLRFGIITNQKTIAIEGN